MMILCLFILLFSGCDQKQNSTGDTFSNKSDTAGTVIAGPEKPGRSKSIANGKIIFESKCKFCHMANSTETLVGPGLKGVLRNATLPVSGKASTAENIIGQLKKPYDKMPSFSYLSEDELTDLVSFLETL